MNALLLVNIQNDFISGGSLALKGGDEVIPLINEMVQDPFDLIVAIKDWHTQDHGSFSSNHEGKKVGDQIHLGGLDQVLWPTHCVQGTHGAEFASGWDITAVDKVFYKGTNPFVECYSVFYENGHRQSTGLESYLRSQGVKRLFFAGFATDYCIKYSVIDALQLGFEVSVITDVCRGINFKDEDSYRARSIMRQGGANLVSFKDLKNLLIKEHNNNC